MGTSVTKVTPIKASLDFAGLGPTDLYAFGCSVYAGMNNNAAFAQPPVDMPTLKSTLDAYNTFIAAALDGSKKVLVQRNHQGEVLMKILKQLAHYVESASKDNMTTFTSTGFEPGGTRYSIIISVVIRSARRSSAAWYDACE